VRKIAKRAHLSACRDAAERHRERAAPQRFDGDLIAARNRVENLEPLSSHHFSAAHSGVA
jgi:hypothetical protein